jgi:phosphoglycerate kinase
VAIIGGSKISGKIDVIDNLLDKVDTLVIVGGMAYTFQRALGVTTGKSLVEEDKIDMAKAALDKAKAKGVKLLLPVDNILADKFRRRRQDAAVGLLGQLPRRLAGPGHRPQVHRGH